MADLNIGDETFRVDITGDPTQPTLLLAHALGTDLTMWNAQVEPLSRHFRVVRFDTRGHGASVRAKGPLSLARLGRDALAIMDALEIETAHFVGGSMGGAVGQWLLINAPHRIDRAVLANTAAKLGTPDSWNGRIRTVLTGGMTGSADATVERWFSPAFIQGESDRVEAIRDVLLSTDPVSYAACCAALRDMDLRESLKTIDRPVLIVTGNDDPVVSTEDLALLMARIEGAVHVPLKAKHISSMEAVAAFNTAVLEFLTAKRPHRKSAARPSRGRSVAPAAPPRATRAVGSRRTGSARSPLRKAGSDAATPPKKADTTSATRRSTAKAGTKNPKAPVGTPAKAAARRPAAKQAAAPAKAKAAVKTPAKAKATAPKSATAKSAPAGAKSTASRRRTGKAATAKAASSKSVGATSAVAKKPTTAKSAAPKPSARKPAASKSAARQTTTRTVRAPKATRAKTGATKPATKPATKSVKAGAAAPAGRRKPTGKPRRPAGRGR